MGQPDKLRNLILYILSHQDYQEGGVKKLNKLLYFIDFYFYRDHERLISDAKYAKAPMGPVIDSYQEVFAKLVADGDLRLIEDVSTKVYKPLRQAEVGMFTSEQVDHISKVLDRYGKLSGRDLEWISHQQQPWVLTENFGDIIDPDLALLIDDEVSDSDTSFIENENLRNELQNLANQAD
ncbi:SocA family protein [Candidatus Uhrbacteria bacterium]|nr:SocA family protein [Candidatus Uhrbacteria bacterium]